MLHSATVQSPIERAAAFLLRIFPRLLGLMFLYAGVIKLFDTEKLRVVLAWDGFPVEMTFPMTYAIIGFEIILGLALVILRPRRWLLAVTAAVMVVYSGQLLVLAMSENAPDCGCMELMQAIEQRNQDRRDNIVGLIRNGLVLLATVWTWILLPTVFNRGFEVLPAKQELATEHTEGTEKKN